MFDGIITPIVTPFNRDKLQSINYDAVYPLVENLIDKGVKGIFVLGSNGEFHVLDQVEKIVYTKKVIEVTKGRVPVYAGTGACSTNETIFLSKEMEKVGVDALSIITPYFIKPNDDELYQYYREVAKSVKIPIILYNIPKNTGVNISPELLRRLAKVKNIKAIKDSSGDIENLKQYMAVSHETGIEIIIGSDSKISEAYKMGARAAIAGTSNVIPEILVKLDIALKNEDVEEANKLQLEIEVLRKVLKKGTVPSVIKRAIELANIAPVGPARKPVLELSRKVDEEIIEMLKYYNLI